MVVGVTTPILQVVGYQNSGKTTLVEKLVTYFTNEGLKIGTMKHHGHGGKPLANDHGKDTDRHRKAGAIATGIEGDGTLQLQVMKQSWSLEDLLSFYHLLPLDLIVVEGYKNEAYPKLVMIRKKDDLELLTKITNIVAIISWLDLEELKIYEQPIFSIHQDQQLLEWLRCYVRDYSG
ncbi:molybdopterin-guanine dinucleotide biosynthesis protein B [Litchfieldia salsa]|uniref:Molybdopterin-guanine dinucleotide biosynthesis protein B n=1 Tax=Litchfieldia salsa TaxID=930152 RepID=A0A1H0S7Z8_9BACI|nr:molybdopterin-guanine dinucleotide biosynthesis protein B [Litchfieldia salsa]SDP37880.1 molybdopterin-guanine dinucleotide biosynthesis protein B [Litchfieldia salsa]